jgi:hypothetical protein
MSPSSRGWMPTRTAALRLVSVENIPGGDARIEIMIAACWRQIEPVMQGRRFERQQGTTRSAHRLGIDQPITLIFGCRHTNPSSIAMGTIGKNCPALHTPNQSWLSCISHVPSSARSKNSARLTSASRPPRTLT